MSSISKALLASIAADLKEQPLAEGELRVIKRMPSGYISLQRVHGGIAWIFSVSIGGVDHFFFKANSFQERDELLRLATLIK